MSAMRNFMAMCEDLPADDAGTSGIIAAPGSKSFSAIGELVRLMEATPAPDLVLPKSRRIKMKDGRTADIKVEWGKYGDNIEVSAEIDGAFAGTANFGLNNSVPDWDEEAIGSWSNMDLFVNTEFRRLGVASMFYDTMAKAGYKVMPSGTYGGKLLPDGHKLWLSQVVHKKSRSPGQLGRSVRNRFWKPRKKPAS